MNAQKVGASLLITTLTCLTPLVGRPALMTHPLTLLFVGSSLLMLLTQPALRWRDLLAHRSTDRFTMALLVGVVVGTQMAALAEWAYGRDTHPVAFRPSLPVGLLLLVLGVALRTWAIAVLNAYFTSVVTVGCAQPLLTHGPYTYLRHPSYTGALLWVTAMPLLLDNTVTVLLTPALLLSAYLLRIRVEERELVAAFGIRYTRYQRVTWRLFPFIW